MEQSDAASPASVNTPAGVNIQASSSVRRHDKYERLIALTQQIPAIPTAVAHPCDESSLRGAVEAAEAGIIVPILAGPAGKIRATAEKAGLNIAPTKSSTRRTATAPPRRRCFWYGRAGPSC